MIKTPNAVRPVGFSTILSNSDGVSGAGTELSYARVANELRMLILSNEIPPGTWVRMQAMADRFGVSIQPVREALQLLQGEGLLEMHANRGARVRGLDHKRLVHIYEIRGALESFMARRFAEHASRADMRALEAIQAQHDAALDTDDWPEIRRANGVFHGYINGHGENLEALAIIRRYYDLSSTIRQRIGFSRPYADRVRKEHHALLDAFRRHDGPAAAEIGLEHVRATLDDLLVQLHRAKDLPLTADEARTRARRRVASKQGSES